MNSFDKSVCPLCGRQTIFIGYGILHYEEYNHEFTYMEDSKRFHITFSNSDGIAEKFLISHGLYRANGITSLTFIYLDELFFQHLPVFKQTMLILRDNRILK